MPVAVNVRSPLGQQYPREPVVRIAHLPDSLSHSFQIPLEPKYDDELSDDCALGEAFKKKFGVFALYSIRLQYCRETDIMLHQVRRISLIMLVQYLFRAVEGEKTHCWKVS
jgi:hypothetical protein